jgi:cobalt-precorrin 5A hydrolase
MAMGEAMIVAGVGCRKAASAADIEAAIATALAQTGLARDALALLATSADKGAESGIAQAAASLGVPLVLVSSEDLAAAGARTLTRSARVLALAGVPSVAEAAALAAAGEAARLLAPRTTHGGAACALADSGEGP